jgi:hypothetical protein
VDWFRNWGLTKPGSDLRQSTRTVSEARVQPMRLEKPLLSESVSASPPPHEPGTDLIESWGHSLLQLGTPVSVGIYFYFSTASFTLRTVEGLGSREKVWTGLEIGGRRSPEAICDRALAPFPKRGSNRCDWENRALPFVSAFFCPHGRTP